MSKLQANVIIFAVLAVLVYMSAFVVNERELAIKFKLGEIVKSDYEPGLYWIIPIFNNIKKFDKRIQTVDSTPEKYLTSEKKNVIVDAFVKWRISDVAQFYRATQGDVRVASTRLSRIINNALKNQISQRTILEVIAGERTQIMNQVRDNVDTESKPLGITIVDVRIKKLDYSESISDSVFERMIQERVKVAKQLRSEGHEEAKGVRAEAEREREQILAEAYRESQSIRGSGDAKAAEIYAEAYGKNPEFFSFYRSLNAYRHAFESGQDVLVLEPDSAFFRYFKDVQGQAR
ncbi:MAG TPA: protease modulator HflC [Gammaproteobacteria bacterium]|jgi:membrane protease subunit HflC